MQNDARKRRAGERDRDRRSVRFVNCTLPAGLSVRLRHLTLTLAWVSLFVSPTAVLGGLWTLRVGGLELMDPLAALSLVATGAPGKSALLAALPFVLLVMLLGRFFCGWLCPYRPLLALSSLLRSGLEARGLRLGRKDLGERSAFVALSGCLLASVALGLPVAAFIYPPAIMMREASSALLLQTTGIGLWVLGFAFLYDLTVQRAGFCRDLCPGGALFRILGRTSPLRLERDEDKCTPCSACDTVCPLGQAPMTDRVSSGCERCGLCAQACPTSALRFGLGRPLPILKPEEKRR